MIFPPSALTVQSLPVQGSVAIHAPLFNPVLRTPADRKAFNYNNFLTVTRIASSDPEYGLPDDDGTWLPSDAAQIAADRMEVTGNVVPAASPCGQNCSYTLDLTSPGYSCSEEHHINLAELLFPTCGGEEGFGLTYKQFLESDITYLVGQNYSTADFNNTTLDVVRLEFQYGWNGTSRHHLSCIFYENTTTAEFKYTDGFLASATMLSSSGTPMTGSIFENPAARLADGVEDIVAGRPDSPAAEAISSEVLLNLNLLGLHEGLATSVAGMEFYTGGIQDGCGLWFNNPLLP